MERLSARGLLAVVAVGIVSLLIGAIADARLRTNPANHKSLIDKPLEDPRYDYANRCLDHPQPGTLALQRWLEKNVRGVSRGIMRCEKLSEDNYSLHSEGRAIDWHLDARKAGEERAANNLIKTLIERDRKGNSSALARRMGVRESSSTARRGGRAKRASGATPTAIRTVAGRRTTSTRPPRTRTTFTSS